jgi:TonB family protein
VAAKPPKTPLTSAQRSRNFLLYGIAISLALHLLAGPFLQIKNPQQEEEKVSVIKRDVVPTPPPTPPPTPKPTPTPVPTPPPKITPPPHTPEPEKPKIKINTLKTNAHNGQSSEAANTHTEGSVNGVPQGTTTAAAAAPVPASTNPPAPPPPPPTPTKPACAVPNAQPKTIEVAEPETPQIAQQQGITGEVTVQIELDEKSHLVGNPVVTKSPSSVLNQAAINAAKHSRYQTEIKDCVPQAAKYLFVVEFQSQ